MDPVRKALEQSKTIAVVGASDNPARASNEVALYLKQQGYRIIPVNPALEELWGEKSYPDVASIPDPVDIVDIFRKPEAVPEIVAQAIQKKARVVWMQPGAENMPAAERAMQAGLEVIMGVCMMEQHRAAQKS